MRPPGSGPGHISTLLCTFSWFTSALSAGLSNVTVDDIGSNIQYTPSDAWQVGNTCDVCNARPDTAKAGAGTWHDSSHEAGDNVVSSATLQFNGSAVYVFCIIAHSSIFPTGNSDMTFFLDDQQVGTFLRPPSGQDKLYDYNVLVYANETIPSGQHTIRIRNGTPGGPKSLLLLDYIVYTTGESEVDPSGSPSLSSASRETAPLRETATSSQGLAPPSSHIPSTNANTSNIGPKVVLIIAAVVPSVIALLLVIGFLVFCTHRRNPHNRYAPPPEIAINREASWPGNETLGTISPFTSTAMASAGGVLKSMPSAVLRPLSTEPTGSSSLSRFMQHRRASTSIASDSMPPAYENIPRDDAVRRDLPVS